MEWIFLGVLTLNTLLLGVLLTRKQPPSPPPAVSLPQPSREPETPDPINEGFENIMRFTVATRSGREQANREEEWF